MGWQACGAGAYMPSPLTGPQDKLLTMSFCKVQKQVTLPLSNGTQ